MTDEPLELDTEQLLASLATPLWVSNAIGDRIRFSQAWLHLRGAAAAHECAGGAIEAIHPDDRRVYLEAIEAAAERVSTLVASYRILDARGAFVELREHARPWLRANGDFGGHIGCCEVLTPRRGGRPARPSDSGVDAPEPSVASGVAHDVKSLLTGILGSLELAGESLPTEHDARDHHDQIRRVVDQASEVCTSLLQVDAHSRTRLEPISASAFVERAAPRLERSAPSSIVVAVALPNDDDLWIRADAVQLERVLTNLVTNALDAIDGTGRIMVRASGTKNSVSFTVEDDGCGIDHAIRDRLFDQYATTKGDGQVAGLGLAIVRTIAAQHRGTIELESNTGSGTRIALRLPRIPRPEAGAM